MIDGKAGRVCCILPRVIIRLVLFQANYEFVFKKISYFTTNNTTGYLKNHWTKHGLVWIQFYAFNVLMPSMRKRFYISDLFINFLKNGRRQ